MSPNPFSPRTAALIVVAFGLSLLIARWAMRTAGGSASPDRAAVEAAAGRAKSGIEAWSRAWERDPGDAALLARGVALARARREAMLLLLRQDPDAALRAAFGYAAYAGLPEEIRSLVEQPFSEAARVDVLAICDSDPKTPELEWRLTFADGSGARLADASASRARLSKIGIPAQGIRLDGWAAARASAFQQVDGEDRDWALANLPLANPSPRSDFLSGEPIDGSGVVALSGGYVFSFASEESLREMESTLRALDDLPGQEVGSAAFLAELAMRASDAFALDAFVGRQKALSLASTTGDKTALFIRVAFADSEGASFESAALKALVDGSVSNALEDYSYGQTSMTATVTGAVFELQDNADAYDDTNALWTEAVAAYVAAGNENPESEYDVVSVAFPGLPFPWAGLATVGGDRQWLNGNVDASVIAHEFGHNYGLLHASYWTHDATDAQSTNPVDPSGQTEEYGDAFDLMGEGPLEAGHFHMAAKQSLGWIGPAQWDDLAGPSDNGTYRVNRFDHRDATGLQGLRIRKSATSDHYWVGLRQLYPASANFERGAYLLWERAAGDPARNRSWLVDATPGSPDGKRDAGIALGRTYADTASGVFITPLSTGGSGAGAYLDVAVNFGPFSGNGAPTGVLEGPSDGAAREPISFSVDSSDPDGDPLAYAWDFGDGVVEPSATSVAHRFAVGGAYTVTLTISDMKGGVATRSMPIEISDPATEWTVREATDAQGGEVVEDLFSIAANGQIAVAVGDDGVIFSSTDGIAWTERPLGGFAANRRLNGVCWTGSEFIAVGRDHLGGGWKGQIYASPDGVAWQLVYQTTFYAGDFGIHDVDSNDDGTLVVAAGGGGRIYARVDGAWEFVDLGYGENVWTDSAGVAYGDGAFVVGGYDFGIQRRVLLRSENGIDWEDIEADSGIPSNGGPDRIDYFDGIFVGSGFAARVVYSEDGGRTWNTLQDGDTYRMSAFAFGNGVFSSHGANASDGGSLIDMLSTDGKTWRIAGGTLDGAVNGRAYFKSRFISVGDGGLIAQSGEVGPAALTDFEEWASAFDLPVGEDGPEADPDDDGLSNFLEYALGSDPADAASAPRAPRLSIDAAGRLAVEVSRLEKTAVPLTVEVSLDLEEWTPLGLDTISDSETALSVLSDESFAGEDSVFVRVRAGE